MKYLINSGRVVVLILLLYSSTLAEETPLLDEWYHINSTPKFTIWGPLSYLPNFDTANGGEHATVMAVIKNDQTNAEIWYHRYKHDTVAQYYWPWGTRNVAQVDLDNNGVLDYISAGRVIRGTKNGCPPENTTVRFYYPWFGAERPYTISDLNNDSYPDVLANHNDDGGSQLISVLVGGPDLKNLQYTLYPRRKEYPGGEYFIGLLNKQQDDGSRRLITMFYDTYKIGLYVYKKWTSLVLWNLKTQMLGDSLAITLTSLDSLPLNTIETGYEFGELQSGMYRSTDNSKEYLFITRYYKGNNGHLVIFDLEGDKFGEVQSFLTNNSNLHILNADINGDGYNDWATRDWDYLYFYAGQKEGADSIPFGRYRLPCTDQIDYVYPIGDVNNDGYNDIALALLPNAGVEGCFAIVLGAPLRTVDVPEPVAGYRTTSYSIQQNYPNPVEGDRRTTIPITVEKPQHLLLELWTLNGRRVGTLREGWMDAGTHTLDVSLLHYHLPASMYVLRLTGAEGAKERAILLD